MRKHEVEIEELPLGRITSDYLETLRFLEKIDLEPAGEFLEVAATLVRMKVRTLLPRSEPVDDEEGEAEGVALLEQLVEHQVARMAADRLEAHEARAASIWFRGRREEDRRDDDEVEIVEADLFSLVSAFRDLMQDLEAPPSFEVRRDEYPVPERAAAIRRRLAQGEGVGFQELFDPTDPRAKLIATFLALLELIRSGEARAFQEGVAGAIVIFAAADGPREEAPEEAGAPETAEVGMNEGSGEDGGDDRRGSPESDEEETE